MAAGERPGMGRLPVEWERMESPLGMVTEMGRGAAVTLERHAVEEGKKWPVVPVSATTGSVTTGGAGGSTGNGGTGSASLEELC